MERKLRVLIVSFHCCIRVVKQALALQKLGVVVDFLHHRIANDEYKFILPRQTRYDGTPDNFALQLKNIVDVTPFDIIHVHNEPDWLGHITKQVCPDYPVVFDVHDLDSLRMGTNIAGQDEEKSFEMCDAFIFPSRGYETAAMIQNNCKKPSAVVYSMCNEEMIGIQQLPRVGGIVFEGGMEVAKDSYINFTDILGEFCKKEVAAHVYPAGGAMEIINGYGSAGSVVMQCMTYGTLLRQLSRYDWGFVGAPRPDNPQWNIAMPNKLFEFMAAGIPVIVHHASEVAEFVLKHDVGIVVENVDEIKARYFMHELYRDKVKAKRGLFTMESQSLKIMEIYDKALDVEKERRLAQAGEQVADQERGIDCD